MQLPNVIVQSGYILSFNFQQAAFTVSLITKRHNGDAMACLLLHIFIVSCNRVNKLINCILQLLKACISPPSIIARVHRTRHIQHKNDIHGLRRLG